LKERGIAVDLERSGIRELVLLLTQLTAAIDADFETKPNYRYAHDDMPRRRSDYFKLLLLAETI
jgi:hypothetical protein